jgi:2-iminobutanoate/2-iminopropanoate deaminase
MNTPHNPPNVGHGLAHYSLGIEVPAGARLLFIAGQVPVAPDGSVSKTIEGQAECVWKNVQAVLRSAGMGLEDLVKMTMFVTSADARKAAADVRAKVFGGIRMPASTGIIVKALPHPDWMIEVEAVAAKV